MSRPAPKPTTHSKLPTALTSPIEVGEKCARSPRGRDPRGRFRTTPPATRMCARGVTDRSTRQTAAIGHMAVGRAASATQTVKIAGWR